MMVNVSEAISPPPIDDLVAGWWAHASTPMMMCDSAALVLGVNDAFANLVGHEETSLIGNGLLSVLGERDRAWVGSYIDRLALGELDQVDAQAQILRAGESPIECLIRIEPGVDDGGRRCLTVLVRELDVEPSVDVEDRMSRLLAHIEDEITLVDRKGRIVSTSGLLRETLSYPPEFWQNRGVLDILAPEDRDRVLTAFVDLMTRPGDNISGEFSVIASDGTRAVLEADAVNLLDEPGIHAIVLTTRNISDRLRTMDELRISRDTALEAVERLGHVVATIGHELRNPLHAVCGIAELLASARLDQRERDLTTTLVTELDHLARVTASLLDSARADATQVESRPTDLRALLREVTTLAEAGAGHTVAVTSSIDDDVPRWVETDEVRLHQILANLTQNATKYSTEGSISISCRRIDDELVFEVTDTGRGIDPSDLDRIFEKFHVGSNADAEAGAGLGLSIVKHLVELLGGQVEAQSTIGEGSRFRVRVPLVACGEPPSTPIVAITRDVSTASSVIVVEDNVLNQQLAIAQLEVLGYSATTFASGEAVIDLACEGLDPSVVAILMDYQLDGINGCETTERLRNLGLMVPIIGFTANAAAARRRALHDAGMDDVLVKPVGLADLDGALRRATGSTSNGHATTARGSAASPAIVDPTILDQLAAELGDVEPVRSLIATFLAELDDRWLAITTPATHPQVRRREAHTLKSTARLVGATALADACALVESDEKSAPAVELAHTTAELLREWQPAKDVAETPNTGVDAS